MSVVLIIVKDHLDTWGAGQPLENMGHLAIWVACDMVMPRSCQGPCLGLWSCYDCGRF